MPSPSALALYDYILTFPAELDRFWSPLKIRQWGTLIFIINRYVGLWGHVPIIYSYFFVPPSDTLVGQQDSKCYPLHKYHQFLAVTVQTSVGGKTIAVSLERSLKVHRQLFCSPGYTLFGIAAESSCGVYWVITLVSLGSLRCAIR